MAVDAVDAVGTGTLSLTRDAELAETWTAMADAKAKAILPWSKVAWVDTMWIGTGVAAQTGLKAQTRTRMRIRVRTWRRTGTMETEEG